MMRVLVVVFVCVTGLLGCQNGNPDLNQSRNKNFGTRLSPTDIATHNRGIGLMGRFEYTQAHQLFTQLAEQHPDQPDVQVNLAIATLNRQQAGDAESALAILGHVLEADPHHLRAQYCQGLLLFHLGRTQEALGHFRTVTTADPKDAYAAYFLAQGLVQQGQLEDAVGWYERAIETDPYLRSAYYGVFQAYQRIGQADNARAALDIFQRLQGNPQARLAEIKYTRMGPKAATVAIDLASAVSVTSAAPPALPPGDAFGAAQAFAAQAPAGGWAAASQYPSLAPSLTAADINADGRLDVFIASAQSGDRPNAVFLADETGSVEFRLETEHPLAVVPGVQAAAWGDFDNDGLTDSYLCRKGPNQLWRQHQAGQWQNVTQSTQTAAGESDSRDCLFVDADHDGDLDVFVVNADGPNELLNNNLDGTFRPLVAERDVFGQALAGQHASSQSLIPVDLDGDRDVDLIVLHAMPPHDVFVNDRLWQYRPAQGFEGFRAADIQAVVAADVNADGQSELYSLDASGGLQRWQPDETDRWQAQDLMQIPVSLSDVPHTSDPASDSRSDPAFSPPPLAVLDVNGDGQAEILVSTPTAWAAYHLTDLQTGELVTSLAQPVFRADAPDQTACSVWAPVVLEPTRGPAVLGLCGKPGKEGKHKPFVWSPGPGRYPFAGLSVSGQQDSQHTMHTMRSNASGIGTRIAARFGSRWLVADTFRHSSGPGQSVQPLSLGTGGAPQFDFVAINWSDGVFQSELDLAVNTSHRIVEVQRQLSSCPVLFAWNGTKFAFVSDILGVGGLGFAVGPNKYAPARPQENFLLPDGLLSVKDHRYILKLTQPMEEVCYLDQARLVAYELPPDWNMVLDERMGVRGPQPSGAPIFFRHERLPIRATNERGEVVTPQILSTDRQAAPLGALDRRFIGRLAEEHVLTLYFAQPITPNANGHELSQDSAVPNPLGQPVLVADGWVEYPYSQTMFSAWQAGAAYEAPTLEAQGANGVWTVVAEQFGYPAGMPRRMAFPLEGLPAATQALRLRTNQEIYWDRLAIVYAESLSEAKKMVLPLHAAHLSHVGFPRRTTAAQRVPAYDYRLRRPFDDVRFLDGMYTNFGLVTPLLRDFDDALAIFGPGEEVHMEFAGLTDSPPIGWKRHFVLESMGWAKDMDLYTRDGETVGPLPTTGKAAGLREKLHKRYQTRYASGFFQEDQ